MGIKNPEELNDAEFDKLLAEFLYIRNFDKQFYLSILRQAIKEAFQSNENE